MSELRMEKKRMRVADLGEECCVPDLLGEYVLQNHLEFHLSEDDEIYEGYGRRNNTYPYRQFNSYTRELKEKDVETAVLENQYLKAVFLPEYGGRLWELWDKTTGINLLYTNDVIRFSNLATRNAWFSGGVEWNLGIIGHTPLTTSPMYVAVTETKTGAPVLRMYEYERIRKVPYQMDFWLEEEDRFLNCRMRIVNESEQVVPMYWWSNIAVPEYEDGCIVVPADKAFTNRDGDVIKVSIPMVDGIDVTDYKKIPFSVDYFFEIEEGKPKYIANLNKDGYGLLQRSTKRLRSRKLFSWGSCQASDHWQEFLTDKAGRYLEIQAGLAKTQYGCIPMAPHTAWEWLEQYGAVSLPKHVKEGSHEEREKTLTEILQKSKCPEQMEQLLKNTSSMAKQGAKLEMLGSEYGALAEGWKYSNHLEFVQRSESLKKWKQFFDTGILHQPSADKIPDECMIDGENLEFLIGTLDRENKENWYAFYQAGLGCFQEEQYEQAKTFFCRSWELEESAWVCHGMASTCIMLKQDTEAVQWVLRGLKLENKNVSFLKESLKLLHLCNANREIIDFVEHQNPEIQKVGKLAFYYISALHRTGEDQKAYELLEKDGGLVIEDIREGEDSFAQLWGELYENLYGEKGEIPYCYDFKAF